MQNTKQLPNKKSPDIGLETPIALNFYCGAISQITKNLIETPNNPISIAESKFLLYLFYIPLDELKKLLVTKIELVKAINDSFKSLNNEFLGLILDFVHSIRNSSIKWFLEEDEILNQNFLQKDGYDADIKATVSTFNSEIYFRLPTASPAILLNTNNVDAILNSLFVLLEELIHLRQSSDNIDEVTLLTLNVKVKKSTGGIVKELLDKMVESDVNFTLIQYIPSLYETAWYKNRLKSSTYDSHYPLDIAQFLSFFNIYLFVLNDPDKNLLFIEALKNIAEYISRSSKEILFTFFESEFSTDIINQYFQILFVKQGLDKDQLETIKTYRISELKDVSVFTIFLTYLFFNEKDLPISAIRIIQQIKEHFINYQDELPYIDKGVVSVVHKIIHTEFT